MLLFRHGCLWGFLSGTQWVMGLLWLGLAAFSVALVVLIWTRWGQYRPIRKCLLLSLLAHLLLAGYATTVQIVGLTPAIREPVMQITVFDAPVGPGRGGGDPKAGQTAGDDLQDGIDEPPAKMPSAPVQTTDTKPSAATQAPKAIPIQAIASNVQSPAGWSLADVAEQFLQNGDEASGAESAEASPQAGSIAGAADAATGAAPFTIPDAYRLRVASDHVAAARAGGGSPETEAAVRAARKWLAGQQDPNGRWNARQHEAGRETKADGQSRPNAGLEADTGMTGLALLSLLAAGDTHLRGDNQENVRRGLEFLMQSQDSNGSLAGTSETFAAMYCHAMATFALSEAYGMTGDKRLEPPLRRAIEYTVFAQDPQGGGWRYQPHDPGDTSQLGWQLMALKSAELAGIPIPDRTRQAVVRYLQSVASGSHGGRASYQPGKQATRTMTAEALVCWQFLGMAREHPACDEAAAFLMGELPGDTQPNHYYWYYGTLATYQLQGEPWRRWNAAIRGQLLATQRTDGPQAGSWDPDSLWGGYGGRIYSTSLAALCLEVYYRYLPLYSHGTSVDNDNPSPFPPPSSPEQFSQR